MQADGKILVTVQGKEIVHSVVTPTSTNTTIRWSYVLLRFNADGSEDPAFSPVLDNVALFKAFGADGRFFAGGFFTNASGAAVSGLAQFRNTEPAPQSLAFDGTNVVWLRGGASPEVNRAAFQYSADGRAWTNLGAGVRIPGGWRLENVSLPRFGAIRAQGFLNGSLYESTIDIAGLKLGAQAERSGNGPIRLTATASSLRLVEVQTSADLRTWTTVRTNLVGIQPMEIALTNPPAPHAFFRLVERINP